MRAGFLWLAAMSAAVGWGQSPCAGTPAYTPCEMTFEADSAVHPRPYLSADLRIEFRSPRQRTFLMPAYWDGGTRLVVRFAPTEAGEWDYRVSSNLPAHNGKTGRFTAAASGAPGFLRAANTYHWAYTEGNRPHLWMGAWMGGAAADFSTMEDTGFRQLVDARAAQKFTHLAGRLLVAKAFASPDSPDVEYFRRLEERVRYLNQNGLVADIILAGSAGELARHFPNPAQRRRYIRYVVGRLSAMNVTWLGAQEFEDHPEGRTLLREVGALLKEMDPYRHPRSSGARVTSAPLLEDGWMDFASYGTSDHAVGAIEHQIFPVPLVSLVCASEEGGADAMRRRLWNATMSGQYPTFRPPADTPDSPGARQMKVWYEFFADTRYWDLVPYFDVDGGRALALEDVEYIVYVEKPGPIELLVERHGYDVEWVNPATGETIRKKFKGERFTGEPPDRTRDWVLHVVREGRIESMNRSYRFESRRIVLQELEQNTPKVPFEIEQPAGDLTLGKPAAFSARIKRETRATRSMTWLWTGEVTSEGRGYRVLGTTGKGTFTLPPGTADKLPNVLNLRLYGMNANGKVYVLDRACPLTP